ncbi:hypothetical protein [Streptomyces venezuelae]|uniref:hypothetical protein n=1 Tax=Streptomyces venezuelae TaxID=54571 RepID=UPI001CC23246|nr:hypothetical protein [Streptomyces venezuelae]
MHPTRTTTTLLLGVAAAVSAVSGCVHVNPAAVQPATAPTAGVPPQHETRSGRGAAPVEVQAPALEALRTAPDPVAEDGAAGAAAPAAPDRRTEGAPAAGSAPQETAPDRSELPPPVPDIPEPPDPAQSASGRGEAEGKGRGRREGEGDQRRKRREARKVERELMKRLPMQPADVCALGRRHDSWQPDSPEARICAGVEG